MARIEGVNLPTNKRIEYALPYIFGIGLVRAREILTKLNVDYNKRVKDLNDSEVAAIQKEITENYRVGGELRREISMNISRLIETGSYRGLRHKKGLPARGQRTKTNARTRKGPRKQPVTLKRKVTKK
jgi:small subunit ribosomal protein S13